MSEPKKNLFDLFRSRSKSEKKLSKDPPPKSDKERKHRRERPATSNSPRTPEKPSTRSPHAKSEPRRSSGVRTPAPKNTPAPAPTPKPLAPALTEWPPVDIREDATLTQGKAMELIASGVPVFKGYRRAIAYASDEYYNLYATCEGNSGAGSDGAETYHAFSCRSFRLRGPGPAKYPWETLEQPSLEFCYGTLQGTITLNHWVSLSGRPNPYLTMVDPGVKPRDVELGVIFERLIYLETGFEEDDPNLMYKNLYSNLLKDPDRFRNPHKAMEKQITDLITVLSGPQWTDFSKPENQIVAKYFLNESYTDDGTHKKFFHQLLLSTELDRRIHSKHHKEGPKQKLIDALPPCVRWDLALARRWREGMTIERFKSSKEGGRVQIKFNLKVKRSQIKALRRFAKTMKWPNLKEVDKVLDINDTSSPASKPLENRSSDSMSFYTGVILPGPTLPWLIMNSLIDADPDSASASALQALTHIHPNTGFQYRSTTYWSASSIVGKVLAPTCKELGGWIGPARPAPDLERIQIARIRQRKPKQYLTISDVETMTERSDPLGPTPDSKLYPVAEYTLVLPEHDPYNMIDTIRIEKLGLRPASSTQKDKEKGKEKERSKDTIYDAAVQFAIDGKSWPLRLSYDVSFINACPCARGPHPLFFDYVYKAVRVDEILRIKDWGGIVYSNSSNPSSSQPSNSKPGSPSNSDPSNSKTGNGKMEGEGKGEQEEEEVDRERVLVIEAFGVKDNEVFARAWCSHWGLSAVVADVDRTCMGCAVREAYAGCVNVVLLVDRVDDD